MNNRGEYERITQPAGSDLALHHNEHLLEALNAEKARGYIGLRFDERLEGLFRDYLAESGRLTRVALFLLVLAILLAVPWFTAQVLSEPADFRTVSDLLIYIQAPAMVAGALTAWFRPMSRSVDWLCIVVYITCVAASLTQRSIAVSYGFAVPLEWIGLATTALLVASRTRFWFALPWVLLATVATVVNEWLFVVNTVGDFYPVTTLVLLIALTCFGGYSLEYFMRRTWIDNCLLEHVSRHDGLTGLLNRKALAGAAEHMIAHAYRERCAFAVAMIDIDYFKDYNDCYGHPAGDRVLCRVADILRGAARRPQDFCGRYGGEEFLLAWADGEYDDVCQLAETLRDQIERAHMRHAESHVSDRITVSIGLYWMGPDYAYELANDLHDSSQDGPGRLFDSVDKLLYKAKVGGRNRVVSAWAASSVPESRLQANM